MDSVWKKIVLVLFAWMIVLGMFAPVSHAVWHTFLDEHFNKDQQNPNLRWPWYTDLRNGIRWHWNPWPPHFRAENPPPRPSDYCWGIQDHIFCSRVLPNDPIQQALWCAYTNVRNVDEPRWPEDDDYENNQNAWVWWGPADLSNAVAAAVTYWVYLDIDHYAYDSLSCIATNEYGLLRTQGDDFFDNVPVGRSYSVNIGRDWTWQYFYLDSLVVAGDDDEYVSMLGEEEVYIGFVWHSNRFEVAGKGAFIDDVIFSWDDGLFDLVPIEAEIGYPINEDSTDWTDESPDAGDIVKFRMQFRAIGVGETPEFTVQCFLDDSTFSRADSLLIHSQVFQVEGSDTTVHTVEADTLYEVVHGRHSVRWEVDVPIDDGGEVEEGNEENNDLARNFNVVYNPPPTFVMEEPSEDSTRINGIESALIQWSLEDTIQSDRFRVILYWTEDTTGLAENPELLDDYGYIGVNPDVAEGRGNYVWPATGGRLGGYTSVVDSGAVFWVVGIALDNFPNTVLSVSPGRFWFDPEEESAPNISKLPVKMELSSAFPNPFNETIMLHYGITVNGYTEINVFDMSGRIVDTVYKGNLSAGYHSSSWTPANTPAGIYIVKLKSGKHTDLQKIIYMP